MMDTSLKDQIITGIRDTDLRERLLQERPLSLTKCLDMCRAAETASMQAKEMSQGAVADVYYVNRRESEPRSRQASRQPGQKTPKRQCKFCGRHHAMAPGVCPAIDRTCHKCGQKGHFIAKCDGLRVNQVEDPKPQSQGTGPNQQGLQPDPSVGAITSIFAVCPEHKAKMRVQGKTKSFPLDNGTGAILTALTIWM